MSRTVRGEHPTARTTSGRERFERLAFWVVVVVLLLPLAITAIRVLGRGDLNPGGDRALIELRVRDVGRHTPLLGSYGRYGFNQPGPMWFLLLAVPYRLLGSHYSGLQLGALALSAASVVTILVISRRRGGVVLLLWSALLVGALLHGLGPTWMADPWEPRGLTLACAALIFLVYESVVGSVVALPIAAAVATLLAQAQAGLVAFGVSMLAFAAGAVVVRVVRHRGAVETTESNEANDATTSRTRAVRMLIFSGALLVLLWVPPLIAVARHETGNLAAMWRSLRSSGDTLGFGDALRAVSLQLGPRAPWLGFHETLRPFDTTLDLGGIAVVPVALVLLVAATVFAWRRRDESVALGAAVLIAIAAAVIALGRLLGPLFFWIPEWTRAVGMAAGVAIGWCAYRGAGDRVRDRTGRIAVPVIAIGIAVIFVMSTSDALRDNTQADPNIDAVHQLAADVLPTARAANGSVLVTATPDQSQLLGSDPGLPTLALDLARDGVDVVVDPSLEDHFGPHRARAAPATLELRLATDADPVPDGYHVVATVDPLTADQRAERQRLLAQLPGLSPDPTAKEIFDLVAAHPELEPIARQLGSIPAEHVISVLSRDLR
jgi:hypothetical protein